MNKYTYERGLKNILIIISVILFAAGCKKENSPTPVDPNAIYLLKLSFVNKVGTDALVLGNTYTNPHGESMKVSLFKYYISNISLIDENGVATKLPDTYFLINHQSPASTSFEVKTKGNRFKAIQFMVGVDSTRNVSGVQTGALDPANAMFWTWSTGYIMAKLEGTYGAGGIYSFAYDIGGFQGSEASQRTVVLNLPQSVVLKTFAASEVLVQANVNAWFKGSYDVKLATDPFSLNPGPLAMKIADNYAKMFAVMEVKNQ